MFRFSVCSCCLFILSFLTTFGANAQSEDRLALSSRLKVIIESDELSPLVDVIAKDYYLLAGLDTTGNGPKTIITLSLDQDKSAEAYELQVSTKGIYISGGTYGAVTMGLTDLWHSIDDDRTVPFAECYDQPAYPYRSVMLDNGRAWHEPETVREAIDLCRWYKLNYLHLHLTRFLKLNVLFNSANPGLHVVEFSAW